MARPDPLVPLVRRMIDDDPARVARLLEALPEEELLSTLRALPATVAGKAFPHLQAGYAAALLATASQELFATAMRAMPAERAARIFARLPSEARERFVPNLPPKIRAEVQTLLTYPEGSVGQMMGGGFLALDAGTSVRDAVKKIRAAARRERSGTYVYVIDGNHHLLGVASTFDLLIASPTTRLEAIMRTDAFTLDPFMDQKQAAEELGKRNYFAAPVVDARGELLGIVKAEQLLAGVRNKMVTDLQKMVGVGAEERAFSPIRFSLRKRLPWLCVNLVTVFAAAAVVALFEDLIAQVTALAVFLPVVAGQGGNAGAQSLAIVMRGIVMREIPRERVRGLILKEGALGVVNGVATGLLTAVVAWLWMGNPWLGLVVGLGMVVNLACAGLAGASIPIIMKRLGLDPAQSSSIILTTVTDIVGFFAYLGFALLFLTRLL